MKSRRIKKTMTILELNTYEADWLMAVVQNPIGCSHEEERDQNKEMRNKIWKALTVELEEE